MQKKLYSIEEDNYILESILKNSSQDINSIAESTFKKFKKARTLASYIMRIHNIRSYLLNKGLDGIGPKHKHIIDNFLKNNSKERFISQLEAI